jgi:hypothetical protein
MNYSDRPNMCRVDFFTESGKWKYTAAVWFDDDTYSGTLIHDAFIVALYKFFISKDATLHYCSGMRAVCLEPHHEHSHPISMMLPQEQSEFHKTMLKVLEK